MIGPKIYLIKVVLMVLLFFKSYLEVFSLLEEHALKKKYTAESFGQLTFMVWYTIL
ncbi:hypothetical protein KHA80_06145 [Anaerobacillus sp. HL2]|nr:hypothetical protein KHA80_06145 [Anaerobacillus sp. HL2]